jgi:hypothetical protein
LFGRSTASDKHRVAQIALAEYAARDGRNASNAIAGRHLLLVHGEHLREHDA